MKWLALIFILCLTVSVDANPFLTAEPVETPDYYVVSINGEAETVSPTPPDEVLKYDLESLALGKHTVAISAGGIIEGEGPAIQFIIHKTQNKKWTIYTIELLDSNTIPFVDPLHVKIRTETQTRTGSKKRSGCS